MLFDRENRVFRIACREFVAIARRGISESVPVDDDEPRFSDTERIARRKYFANAPIQKLCYTFSCGDNVFELTARADGIDEGHVLSFLCPTDASPSHPPKEWTAQMRAEGYVAAHAYLACTAGEAATLRFLYVNVERDEEVTVDERVSAKTLAAFFEKCRLALARFAEPAIDRVSVRLPSLSRLAFPYPSMREGQEVFIRAVYRNIARGTRLYAEAPTGIGKTVSAIYPALRAMGDGKCDKVFYLTPKTTIALAACECLQRLGDHGAQVRGVLLVAKEKICQNRTICRESRGACEFLRKNRLAEAALSLFREKKTIVLPQDVRRCAVAHGVCPYELSLTYAELADLVVCDFNYLFDPTVYLRRFFDTGNNYAILIDEAHNLPDRASAMYSAQIDDDALDGFSPAIGESSSLRTEAHAIAEEVRHVLRRLLADGLHKDDTGEVYGSAHGRSVPPSLDESFRKLLRLSENELFRAYADKTNDKEAHIREVRAYYYRIRGFVDILDRFDEKYEWFAFLEHGTLTWKLFCIDPSGVIDQRLRTVGSAVFFSATLSPISYYKSLLAADGTSEVLAVDSPFDPRRLSVSIMDRINIRAADRDRTLPSVIRVIEATIAPKRGNYMIFSPSFVYNEMLAAAFRKKHPNIRVMEQTRGMSEEARRSFIDAFSENDPSYLIAFCVMGGIYAEGIDLCGDRLIGAVIVGVGLPQISFEREAMCSYFDERFDAGKQYAYVYPGMNKVLQAAGRVIRREEDRGVIVLIDDRFADPVYKKSIPTLWHGLKFVGDAKGLHMLVDRFWHSDRDAEKRG